MVLIRHLGFSILMIIMGCHTSIKSSNTKLHNIDSLCLKLYDDANKFSFDNSFDLEQNDIFEKIVTKYDLAIMCDSMFFDPVFQKAQLFLYKNKYTEVIDMYENFNIPLVLLQTGLCYNKMNIKDSTDVYIEKALNLSKKQFYEEKSYSNLETLIMVNAGILQIEKAKEILKKNIDIISKEQYKFLEKLINSYKNGNMDPNFIIK